MALKCHRKCLTKIPKSFKISRGNNGSINHNRSTRISKINGEFDNSYPFIIGIHKGLSFTKPNLLKSFLRKRSMRIFVFLCAFICLCIRAGADVKFTDVTDAAGIEFQHFTGATGKRYMPETMGAGCAFLDYDADGNLDILFASSDLFINIARECCRY